MRKVTVARMTVIDIDVRRGNPLEVVERVASTHQWSFERAGEDELTIVVRGKWTDYQVSFTWMFDIESLHLACAFELKVPERSQAEVERLLAMINAQLWVGHFDLWSADGLVMFRHSLVLAGGVEASGRQCEVNGTIRHSNSSSGPVRVPRKRLKRRHLRLPGRRDAGTQLAAASEPQTGCRAFSQHFSTEAE
jgi:hypothetical protein